MVLSQVSVENETLYIHGDLNFHTVMTIHRDSFAKLENMPVWNINLGKLSACNSAALALILEWVNVAKRKKREIRIGDFPLDLLSIAKAAGIEELLQRYSI